MQDLFASGALALRLIAGGDPELWGSVGLSLEVSLASAVLACGNGTSAVGSTRSVVTFPFCTSRGKSMRTGPIGAVVATRKASCTMPGTSAAVRGWKTALVTGATMAGVGAS